MLLFLSLKHRQPLAIDGALWAEIPLLLRFTHQKLGMTALPPPVSGRVGFRFPYLCGMKYQTEIGDSIETAAHWLKEGHLVAFPTETVYGLAGNALDPAAVVQIFETKERPLYNPLIVHAANPEQARQLTREWPKGLDHLIDTFWPGPLTLLLDRQTQIPDLVTAGLDRVAIRIPEHALALSLIETCGFPLAAPSANLFSRISPTTADHVFRQLEGRIPYILDGGPCAVGLESTILGLDQGHWTIYRQGAITAADLEAFLGRVQTIKPTESPVAPGMLPMHYAPRSPLTFGAIGSHASDLANPRIGWLLFQEDRDVAGPRFILAPDGDLRSAARRLYAGLHELDQLQLDAIMAEPAPDQGLGRAINDRLQRAAVSA